MKLHLLVFQSILFLASLQCANAQNNIFEIFFTFLALLTGGFFGGGGDDGGSGGGGNPTTLFDADIIPDIVFGTGNSNGGFAITREGDIEVGIRAKTRFDENCRPNGNIPIVNDGVYSFPKATICTFDNQNEVAPVFNVDWHVNSDFTCGSSSCTNIAAFDYVLELDYDPTFTSTGSSTRIDLLAFGNDNTLARNSFSGNEGQTFNPFIFPIQINFFNVMQNSANFDFFQSLTPIDPFAVGIYTVTLSALQKDTDNELATVEITVLVGDLQTEFPQEIADCDSYGTFGLFATQTECESFVSLITTE